MRAKKRGLLSILIVVCLLFTMAMPVWADEVTDAVNKNRNGVVEVLTGFTDKNGEFYGVKGGSGFLVGDQALITNAHVVNLTDDEQATAKAAMVENGTISQETADKNLTVAVKVVVTRDVMIDCSISAQSKEMDIAVVALGSSIGDRTPLVFQDNGADKPIEETESVYALGFPDAAMSHFYTSEDVTVTDGIVSKLLNNDISWIQHNAQVSAGNSGGPLINASGAVVGMNTIISVGESGDNYFYAISATEIMDLLVKINVPFNTTSGAGKTAASEPTTAPEPTEAPVETPVSVDKTGLSTAITSAKDIDSSAYTTESYGLVESKLADAQAVVDNADATQADIDTAKDALNSTVEALEEASTGMPLWMILAIVAATVVIVIIVIIILAVSSKRKKNDEMRSKTVTGGFGGTTIDRESQGRGPQIITPSTPPYVPEGAGETGVLNEGSADTTVLGGTQAQVGAYLMRKKNNERISLPGGVFTLGKERRRVSYCISDNTAISRCHAQIVRKGNNYFITDMNSTNFTFVNGVKAAPNQEVALTNHAKIRLADEEFEFILQ